MSDTTTAENNKYLFDVKMTCGGCSGAVERALKKHNVKSFDINRDKQEVEVTSEESYETILEYLKKTGKEVRSGKIIEKTVPDAEAKDPVRAEHVPTDDSIEGAAAAE